VSRFFVEFLVDSHSIGDIVPVVYGAWAMPLTIPLLPTQGEIK